MVSLRFIRREVSELEVRTGLGRDARWMRSDALIGAEEPQIFWEQPPVQGPC
jgi:hypothetical protein